MSDQTPSSYYPEDIPYQPQSNYPTDKEHQEQDVPAPTNEEQTRVTPQPTNGTPNQIGAYTSPEAYNARETKPVPQIEPGSGMAVAGFTLSIISLISWLLPTTLLGLPIPILGIVFSALGFRSTLRRKLALVGLILSILGLLIHIIILGILIFSLLR